MSTRPETPTAHDHLADLRNEAMYDALAAADPAGRVALLWGLADWLEERGHTNPAGYIRAELQMDNAPTPGSPEHRELQLRAEGWWRSLMHRAGFRLPDDSDMTFSGGLPDEYRVSVREFVEAGHEMLSLTPTRRVIVNNVGRSQWDVKDTLQALLDSPHLGRLQGFGLCYGWQGYKDNIPQYLADCQRLQQLRRLHLTHLSLGAEGVRRITSSRYLARLDCLTLLGCELRDDAAAALAESSVLDGVAVLDLSRNRIGEPGAQALADSVHLGRLEELNLSRNRIGDAMVSFADNPRLARLRSVDASYNHISPEVRAALAGCDMPEFAIDDELS